jgi:hypothetical protein
VALLGTRDYTSVTGSTITSSIRGVFTFNSVSFTGQIGKESSYFVATSGLIGTSLLEFRNCSVGEIEVVYGNSERDGVIYILTGCSRCGYGFVGFAG